MLFARGLGTLFPTGTTAQLPGKTSSAGGAIQPAETAGNTRFGVEELFRRLQNDMAARTVATQASFRDLLAQQNVGPCKGIPICPGPFKYSGELMMYPLGTFIVLGVPFNVQEHYAEIQDHHVTQSFVPDQDQRLRIVKALIDSSMSNPNLALYAGAGRFSTPPSIVSVMQHMPEMTLLDEGTGTTPLQPTDDEFNKDGGYDAWVARGGFFFDTNLTRGKKPFTESQRLWGQAYCRCGTDPAMQLVNGSGQPWEFTIDTTKPTWILKGEPKDRSAAQAILGTLASIMKALSEAICAAVSANQLPAIEQRLTSELCVDVTTNQSCKKGASSSCICTKPSNAQQAAMGTFNFAAQQICARQDWSTPPIVKPPGGTPQIFAPPAPKIPWWLIVLASGVGGAVLFAKKQA
jgi:hypothetical protein